MKWKLEALEYDAIDKKEEWVAVAEGPSTLAFHNALQTAIIISTRTGQEVRVLIEGEVSHMYDTHLSKYKDERDSA